MDLIQVTTTTITRDQTLDSPTQVSVCHRQVKGSLLPWTSYWQQGQVQVWQPAGVTDSKSDSDILDLSCYSGDLVVPAASPSAWLNPSHYESLGRCHGHRVTPSAGGRGHDIYFFGHKNPLFGHNRFSTLFFAMKVAESEKIVLASGIIDFKDIHVWSRHFSLNLNACRVMTVFFSYDGLLQRPS